MLPRIPVLLFALHSLILSAGPAAAMDSFPVKVTVDASRPLRAVPPLKRRRTMMTKSRCRF